MGILSFLGKKKGPSEHFLEACAVATRRPLEDETRRVVVASHAKRLIFDLTIYEVNAHLSLAEGAGLQSYRASATKIIAMALSGLDLGKPELLSAAVVAYFDRAYLVSVGPFWNTLGLDVAVDGTHLDISRAAIMLPYPTAVEVAPMPAIEVKAAPAPSLPAKPPEPKRVVVYGTRPPCAAAAHDWSAPLYCHKHVVVRMRIYFKDEVKPCGRRCLRCGMIEPLPTVSVGGDPDPRCFPDSPATFMTADDWEGAKPAK